MDLEDSFTEKLLQRNRVRKQYKTIKENETTEVILKKRYALIEEQQFRNSETVKEDSPKRSCEESDDDSPKRPCLEQYEGSPSRRWPPQHRNSHEKENTPVKEDPKEAFVPFTASHNVRGLAALKKADNYDSNVRKFALSKQEEAKSYVFSTNSSELCTGRKTRFASLAANINEWEDDTQQSVNSCFDSSNFSKEKSNSAPPSNSLHTTFDFDEKKSVLSHIQSPVKKVSFQSNDKKESPRKLGAWDQAIKATLENEETKASPLKTYNATIETGESYKAEAKSKINNASEINSVKSKLKFFGNVQPAEDLNKSFEPSELPLSARKALFERGLNGMGSKVKEHCIEPKLSVAQRAALFENASQKSSGINKAVFPSKTQYTATNQNLSPSKPPHKLINTNIQNSPVKSLLTPEKSGCLEKAIEIKASPSQLASPVKKLNTDTQAVEQMLLARVNSKSEMKDLQICKEDKAPKPSNTMVNFWEKLSASSKSGNSNSEEDLSEKHDVTESEIYDSEDDHAAYESETESKYERETESEFNYNTEVTEEEYSESDPEYDDSGAEENVFKSPKSFPLATKNFDTVSVSSTSAFSRDESSMQDICEDTCDTMSLSDRSSYAETTISTDIRSTGETHQSYASSTSSVGSSYETESLKESEDNTAKNSCGSNCDTNLAYTVSFYRKQKQETRTPPMQTIVRREQIASPSICNQTENIQSQIKLLQQEIVKQQNIIGQTSQALNLCHATAEFSGSTEQVEGERLLLIATQKRQALLNEIQRLKTHGAEGEGVPDGTGTLTITDLQLPLKQEFLAAQLEGKINDAVHWFLCLIRYGAQVIVTQMVSTDDKYSNGTLSFTNHIKLQNLPPDFSIVFEVYALQTQKEKLPHDKKYHIKRDKSTLRLTPKGKKSDNKLLIPSISSPGGPNAVRSPSFGVIGFTRFTIQNCHKKCFTLDKVPYTSPLEGIVRVQLHLHAEHKVMEKGFLTMFEDVSGFGAWHRRWCALNANHLTYWKYPDDEHKKVPIGSIDLKQCVTLEVKPVSRDVCARPHTFQLVTVRPKDKGDKNTLISQCVNTLTTTKHLLSADTKEERILWCSKLNEALTNVRKWDPQAKLSVEANQES